MEVFDIKNIGRGEPRRRLPDRLEFSDLFDPDTEEGMYRYGNIYDSELSDVTFFIVMHSSQGENVVLLYDTMGNLYPVASYDSEFSEVHDDYFVKSKMRLFIGVE